jgi:hypothetical protein
MSKMITGGGAYDLRRRNKHCKVALTGYFASQGQALKPHSLIASMFKKIQVYIIPPQAISKNY